MSESNVEINWTGTLEEWEAQVGSGDNVESRAYKDSFAPADKLVFDTWSGSDHRLIIAAPGSESSLIFEIDKKVTISFERMSNADFIESFAAFVVSLVPEASVVMRVILMNGEDATSGIVKGWHLDSDHNWRSLSQTNGEVVETICSGDRIIQDVVGVLSEKVASLGQLRATSSGQME